MRGTLRRRCSCSDCWTPVSKGYYPSDPEGEDGAPMHFDQDDPAHLVKLWGSLKACLDHAPGFQGRVIFGGLTLDGPTKPHH
ncbi:hypothetical protein Bpfe_031100 [Biomphalaria pfeifferi]|uniref:Uncharacterized protein n=1 Tax=Biomphalaria pfeifferi TaxID=112525 RepID=A0AAD8EU70_BIOPF|nr:hypothetical protein Bpfe_031100 [Biomphalaria pfeifferi]